MSRTQKTSFTLIAILLAMLCCVSFAAAEPGDDPASDAAATSTQTEPEAPADDQQTAEDGADTAGDADAATDLPSDLSDIDLSTVPDIGQQGTDGDELSVTQTSHVEIYLGEEYRGLEFTLETDDGSYPDPVVADGEGKLSFDIGSGDHYTLRCTGEYSRSDSTQEGMADANGSFDDPFPTEEVQKSHFPIWLIVLIVVFGVLFVIYLLRWLGVIDTQRKRRPKQEKEKKNTAATKTQSPSTSDEDDMFGE